MKRRDTHPEAFDTTALEEPAVDKQMCINHFNQQSPLYLNGFNQVDLNSPVSRDKVGSKLPNVTLGCCRLRARARSA